MSSLDKLLIAILSCFVFGVLFPSLSIVSIVPFVAFFICIFLACYFFELKRIRALFLFCICCVSFILGWIRFTVSIQTPSILLSDVGKQVTVTGSISEDPDVRDFNTKIIVQTSHDTILATVSSGVYTYGDTVEVSGILETPENFETDTQRTFDYISYLGKDDIYFLIPKGKATVLSHGEGSSIRIWLFNLKHTILSVFEKSIPEPEQSLLGGILLGAKQSLDDITRKALVTTGTVHIVALSGYNVSIASAFFMQLLSGIGSQILVSVSGIFGILAFVLMTGASSTAIRAGIMASLFIIARLLGRPYDALRILGITAVMMLVANPKLLISDISFQLSFIATAGIIVLEPIIREYFKFLKWRWLISLVSVTLSAQIAVLPFLVWAMGTFSLVSLPVNFLVLPLVEGIMFLGFVTALLGIFIFPVAVPIAYITYVLLHTLLYIVHIGASLPYAAVIVPNFPILVVIGVYSALFYWIYTKYKNRVIN